MAPPPNCAGADSSKRLVLLPRPLIPEFAALAGRFSFVSVDDADAAEARVLVVPALTPVRAELVDRFPALELVAATSVGVDHIDLDACRRRGIAVTNAGDAFSADSADYAVGLVVAVLRRVVAADAYLRRGSWATHGDYPLATKEDGSTEADAVMPSGMRQGAVRRWPPGVGRGKPARPSATSRGVATCT
ncbi:hypothetical protein ABZP36_004313 [Zizania latifolia]